MNRRQFMASACAASLFPHSVFAQTPTLQPIAEGLDHPWGLAFLANNLALVSERSGTLRTISIESGKISSPIAGLPDMGYAMPNCSFCSLQKMVLSLVQIM